MCVLARVQPLMREVLENKVEITKQEARDLVERCLKVLYYRDARSYNRVSPAMTCFTPTKRPVLLKEEQDVERDVQRSSDFSALTL